MFTHDGPDLLLGREGVEAVFEDTDDLGDLQ